MRSYLRKAFEILCLVFLMTQTSWAFSAILSLEKGAELSEAQIQKFLKKENGVVGAREIFSRAEKDFLQKSTFKYLAKAWIVEFKDEESFQALEQKIRRSGLPLLLDYNDLQAHNLSQADLFSGWQWGLYNRGEPQSVDIDPVQNYALPARKGVDVRLLPSPLQSSQEVIVAVLDTGLDITHPDLKNQVKVNPSECTALSKFKECVQNGDRKTCEKTWMDLNHPEVDLDKNGYPLDCHGWSLLGGVNAANIMGRPDFGDDQGHGTHVAGIIAAEAQNGIGIRGITQAVKILPVQVLGKQPSEPLKPLSIDYTPDEKGKERFNRSLGDMVARGVIYAMRSGAKVINFSMGWPQNRDSQFMRDVIRAAQEQGIIIVAAAGNDATKALLRPCAYPGVLCVGAHGPDGSLSHFSNYGGGVELAAPGLNILSTYPQGKRPIRFRNTFGYEFLSGTSQAAPFVAGAVAELLARGVPPREVVPRLLAAADPLLDKMNLLVGTATTGFVALAPERELEQKSVSAGRLNLKAALDVSPQPVLSLHSKERAEIKWDRHSSKLNWTVELVNLWKPLPISDLQLQASILQPHPESIRPRVSRIYPEVPYNKIWSQHEVRRYVVELEIFDALPERSRIGSEVELLLRLQYQGLQRELVAEADITVSVDEDLRGSDVSHFDIENFPQGRTTLIPVDDNRDESQHLRDYFIKSENGKNTQLWLMRQIDSKYQVQGPVTLPLDSSAENMREHTLMRVDWNFDGKPEWLFALFEDKSEADKPVPSVLHLTVLDEQMKIIYQQAYSSEKAEIPFQVSWMKIGQQLVPAWVGPGLDPNKKRSVRDRWENPENYERRKQRFYYFDAAGNLKALEGMGDFKVVDILEPSLAQKLSGLVPVLLARNQGFESKPSYLYDFAQAQIQEAQISGFKEMLGGLRENPYRNILETRVDRVLNLDSSNNEFVGTFWFGEGLERSQRLSLWNMETGAWSDHDLRALRSQFDSALWVRAAFAGRQQKSSFVLTNTEIQFHDLVSKSTIRRSLERYTFYPDMLFTNLYFPLVLMNSQALNAKLPAIFTTEGSGLNRGVKILAPIFARDGSAVEIVSPAKLRFYSGKGCRPLDTPLFLGVKGAYALDYFCGSKLIRVSLEY
ncbi:MAG: S8 family serine peptidase [Bdellovibrionia bacterium]